MTAPATLLLSILRPMHWLGAQALYVVQPILESLGVGTRSGSSSVGQMARFLERDGSVGELLDNLENNPARSGNKGSSDEPR
jgi:hypothetical protein